MKFSIYLNRRVLVMYEKLAENLPSASSSIKLLPTFGIIFENTDRFPDINVLQFNVNDRQALDLRIMNPLENSLAEPAWKHLTITTFRANSADDTLIIFLSYFSQKKMFDISC